MKKVLFSLMWSLVFTCALAQTTKENAVTMVSYEQAWSDSEGALSVKNNTDEEIYNISFRLVYFDIAGKQLDYKDFLEDVSIEPGMTKKVDVRAYEHDRSYHYYKSASLYPNTSFKLKFELKDYNIEKQDEAGMETDDISTFDEDFFPSRNEGLYMIIGLIAFIFIIGISVGLYVLVAVMAQKRNRNVVIWVLLSLIATPLLMIIILLCIGKDKNNYIE